MNNQATNMTIIGGQQLMPMPRRAGEITIPASNGNAWSFNQKLLSSHLLAIGSIGSGKTNLLYHIVKNVIAKITPQDIVVFFDCLLQLV